MSYERKNILYNLKLAKKEVERLDGLLSLNTKDNFCCQSLASRFDMRFITYNPQYRIWELNFPRLDSDRPEVTGNMTVFEFCPYCGKKLPKDFLISSYNKKE